MEYDYKSETAALRVTEENLQTVIDELCAIGDIFRVNDFVVVQEMQLK